jgi:hypothetical protein
VRPAPPFGCGALTQIILGIVSEKRIHGDRADNLEKAIAAYRAAALCKPWLLRLDRRAQVGPPDA